MFPIRTFRVIEDPEIPFGNLRENTSIYKSADTFPNSASLVLNENYHKATDSTIRPSLEKQV